MTGSRNLIFQIFLRLKNKLLYLFILLFIVFASANAYASSRFIPNLPIIKPPRLYAGLFHPYNSIENLNSYVNNFSNTLSKPLVEKYLAFVGLVESHLSNPYDQYRKGAKPAAIKPNPVRSQPNAASVTNTASIKDNVKSYKYIWRR